MKQNSSLIAILAALLMGMGSLCAQITIGGTGSNHSPNVPIVMSAPNSYSQTIFLSSELNVGSSGANIYGIAFRCNTPERTESRYLHIFMGETDKTTFNDEVDYVSTAGNSSMVKVFGGYLNLVANVDGWYTLWFDAPYHYSGTDNLIVATQDLTGTTESSQTEFYIHFEGQTLVAYDGTINPDHPNRISDSVSRHFKGQYRADTRFMTSPRSDAVVRRLTAPFVETFEDIKTLDALWNITNDKGTYWHVGVLPGLIGQGRPDNFGWVLHYANYTTKAILDSPWIVMDESLPTSLRFDYHIFKYGNDCDTLYVYYRTANAESSTPASGNPFKLLGTYTDTPHWQSDNFMLGGCQMVQVRFEAHCHYGYGVGLDNVVVRNSNNGGGYLLYSTAPYFGFAVDNASEGYPTRLINFKMSGTNNPTWLDTWEGSMVRAGAFVGSSTTGSYYFVDNDNVMRRMNLEAQEGLSTAQIIGTLQGITFVRDMAYNPVNSTLYAIASSGSEFALYAVNTVAATLVAVAELDREIYSMTINNSGQAYAMDYEGQLYQLDLTYGRLTAIGEPDNRLAGSVIRGMVCDPQTQDIIVSVRNFMSGTGGIYSIDPNDTSDGSVVMVGLPANTRSCIMGLAAIPRGVSVDEAESAVRVNLSPNPAVNQASIVSTETVTGWELMTIAGATVRSGEGRKISLEGCAPGLYLVRVSTVNGTSVQKLVVK